MHMETNFYHSPLLPILADVANIQFNFIRETEIKYLVRSNSIIINTFVHFKNFDKFLKTLQNEKDYLYFYFFFNIFFIFLYHSNICNSLFRLCDFFFPVE